jgi:RNA polymerase sigma factor (sigma-70 family)
VIRDVLREPADREDAYQDVVRGLMERKKKALRDWRPIAPFGHYLSVIASRRAVRASMSRGALPSTGLGELPAHYDDVSPGFLGCKPLTNEWQVDDRRLQTTELRLTVREALGTLSPRDRLLLRLRFLEGLDVADVAAMMGLSDGATRKGVFDALRRLERTLDKMEFFEPPMPASED